MQQILRRTAGVSTRAFANHFFSRLKFVGLRSPNKNKYHSTADTYDYSVDYLNVCGNHTTPHNAKKYGFYKMQFCVNMSFNNGGFPCSTVGSPTAQSFT